MAGAVFYYDFSSPYSYLAAERISGLFTDAELEQPEWQPILLGGLFKRFGRDSWANGPGREDGIAEVERRASDYGLPRLVWPDPWPGNTLFAMRAATFAKQTGRTVSFALAGFRQAFAAGRDIAELAADPLRFAAGLVALGEADAAVAGADTPTADVLRAALWAIGTAPGVEIIATTSYSLPVYNGMYPPTMSPAPPWLNHLDRISVRVPFTISPPRLGGYTYHQPPVVKQGIGVQVQMLDYSPAHSAFYGMAGGARIELDGQIRDRVDPLLPRSLTVALRRDHAILVGGLDGLRGELLHEVQHLGLCSLVCPDPRRSGSGSARQATDRRERPNPKD